MAMNLEKRVEKLEGIFGVKEREPLVVVIQLQREEATMPQFAEPVEQWRIYRDAYAKAKHSGLPFLAIDPDPFAEYELRHGLEPGTLSAHHLRGKVPFEALLKAAGCQPETE